MAVFARASTRSATAGVMFAVGKPGVERARVREQPLVAVAHRRDVRVYDLGELRLDLAVADAAAAGASRRRRSWVCRGHAKQSDQRRWAAPSRRSNEAGCAKRLCRTPSLQQTKRGQAS